MAKPRIVVMDIETMSNKIYAWGVYEQNAIEVLEHWYMLSFAWKWVGNNKAYCKALPDYPMYKKEPHNDKSLVEDAWKILNEADVVIGHNLKNFDIKKLNARFAKHGMKPPSPYLVVDTKDVAKRYFRFDSNKLDSLADYFGIGRKINTGGFALWLGCEKGNMKDWAKMKKYNAYDVILDEKVYLHMLPYMNNHPNMGLLLGNKCGCPNCGSENMVKQGQRQTRTNIMQQYQCKSCGAWASKPAKEGSQMR